MSTRRLPSPPRRQRGAILVLALMFLVLLTIIGVSSISGVTLEEKMAGNLRNQSMAFQAAESALRDAEIDLEKDIGGTGNRDGVAGATWRISTVFATACTASFTNGVCRNVAFQNEIVTVSGWDWLDTNKTVRYGTYTGAVALPNIPTTPVNLQPRYVIEYLEGKDIAGTPPTRHFRISARGWGATETSTVTLQTVYRLQMPD